MALRGSGGVWGSRLGSIAYQVLTHSAAPALALPRRRLGGRFSARVAKAITGLLSERDRIEIAGIEALLYETSKYRHLWGFTETHNCRVRALLRRCLEVLWCGLVIRE